MNNNLQAHVLCLKNKEQLLAMVQEAVDFAQDGGEDELFSALEQIEQVTYVLKNCDYEGSQQ